MRWKESLLVGVLRIAKYLLFIYVIWFVLKTNYQLWEDLLRFIGGPSWIRIGFVAQVLALILSIILLYLIGRFSLSRFATARTARKIKSWLLILHGGYKKVWFEGYGPGTAREKVGIVLGKSVIQWPNGRIDRRIIVSRAHIPLSPEPLPLEQAPIIKNKFNPWLYELLGINLPERLELTQWTINLFENLPDYQPPSSAPAGEGEKK